VDPHTVVERGAAPVALLKIDVARDEAVAWHPGPGRRPSEPLFVRAVDGHGDDEGWLLSVVDDASRGTSDIYVLDASSMGRRGPEAVIHLPVRLPLRSHGEWVPADLYR
jgi:carotenoid cleavage dioxygenase